MYNVAQTLIDQLFAPEKVTLVLSNINFEYKVFPGLKPGDSLKTLFRMFCRMSALLKREYLVRVTFSREEMEVTWICTSKLFSVRLNEE